MADPSVFLLLHQIFKNPIFFVQIGVNIHLAYIVEQIKIKVGHTAFFKLTFKNGLDFVHVGQVISGKLCGEIVIFAGIFVQKLSHHKLGLFPVVSPCGVIVVDALFHGAGDHFFSKCRVNLRIISSNGGQAHGSHTEGG